MEVQNSLDGVDWILESVIVRLYSFHKWDCNVSKGVQTKDMLQNGECYQAIIR